MPEVLNLFHERTRRIFDLAQAQQMLEWDQEVVMPARGGDQRAGSLSALASTIHALWIDPALGEWIGRLEQSDALDEWTRADVREARRSHDRAVKIPARLVEERTAVCAKAQAAWIQARPRNDFEAFRPHLERVVALTREMAEAIGTPNRYDALLDDFEPGMTEACLSELFSDLKARLVPLIAAIRASHRQPDASLLRRSYPQAGQEAFCRKVVQDLGFDLEGGRVDVSVHPFTTGTFGDVRLTTRYQEHFLPTSVFGAIHEAGHGIYEQGLSPERYFRPGGQACSMGIHESQSRFWENFIGRSKPFWAFCLPQLKSHFPSVLDDITLDAFHAAVNTVMPNCIRLEADEATYNLHIMLRFELESDLIAGRIEVRDLPEAWNQKMHASFGIIPEEPRFGVLQDIHWSAGMIGYFPSYTLGNLYGAQFMEALRREVPDLDEHLAQGRFGIVKGWLNDRIHRQGRRWLPRELCERVTGAPLSAAPLLRHLEARYADIYDL